jgi:nucleoside-diphosphate-sugar epimerase
VTGPTGEVGRPFVHLLDRSPEVERIVGMARRPFDPAELGWGKVEYRQGDIRDRGAVEALVEGADVVVHLAFIIVAGSGQSREINVAGSRNVFEAAAAAGAKRLVYTSSVAAYGFHDDIPQPIGEDVQPRGTERHPYSAQKAAVEAALDAALEGSNTAAYVFRPCIVAGPKAQLLIDSIPMSSLARHLPGPLRGALGMVPMLRPVLPDPGIVFQLVHHDDVAAALEASVLGSGPPGVYNLAGEGEVTISDLAHELGWHSVPVPHAAVTAAAELVARAPFVPDEAAWIEAARRPVLMSTAKARSKLDWHPRHDAAGVLAETVSAWRKRQG